MCYINNKKIDVVLKKVTVMENISQQTCLGPMTKKSSFRDNYYTLGCRW